jgi:hypothetical protein
MLTFHPVLPMRAAVVAGVAAALGLLAMANLSTSAPERAAQAPKPQLHLLTRAPAMYSVAVVSGVDSFSR